MKAKKRASKSFRDADRKGERRRAPAAAPANLLRRVENAASGQIWGSERPSKGALPAATNRVACVAAQLALGEGLLADDASRIAGDAIRLVELLSEIERRRAKGLCVEREVLEAEYLGHGYGIRSVQASEPLLNGAAAAFFVSGKAL